MKIMYNPFTREKCLDTGLIINIGLSRPKGESLKLIIKEIIGAKGSALYDEYINIVNNALSEDEQILFQVIISNGLSNFLLIDDKKDLAFIKSIYNKSAHIWEMMEAAYLKYI